MIEIKLQFSSINDAIEALNKIQSNAPVQTSFLAAPAPAAEAPAPAIEAPAPEAKRGRPAKKAQSFETPAAGGDNNSGSDGSNSSSQETQEAVAVEPPVVEAPKAETPVADDKTYTLDDARQALTRLNDSEGLDAVRKLLTEFGANRISEVAEENLAALIARCPA